MLSVWLSTLETISSSMSVTCFFDSAGTACCEGASEPCEQHTPAVSDMDTVTFLSLCFSFPSSGAHAVTSLSGHVECINRGGGGLVFQAEGCSEGDEGESCPTVPGMCSQLAGKDVPGASSGVRLCPLHPDPLLSVMVPSLEPFSPPLLHKAYLKGLCH